MELRRLAAQLARLDLKTKGTDRVWASASRLVHELPIRTHGGRTSETGIRGLRIVIHLSRMMGIKEALRTDHRPVSFQSATAMSAEDFFWMSPSSHP